MAIRSFLHPGLERFARTGDTSGIVAQHAPKLNQLLAQLSFSGGSSLHLKQVPGFHSVKLKLSFVAHPERSHHGEVRSATSSLRISSFEMPLSVLFLRQAVA